MLQIPFCFKNLEKAGAKCKHIKKRKNVFLICERSQTNPQGSNAYLKLHTCYKVKTNLSRTNILNDKIVLHII